MNINDIPLGNQEDEEIASTPKPAIMPMPKMEPDKMPSGAEENENIQPHASLFQRANNFLAGRPSVHQHEHPLPPGEQQPQVLDPRFQSAKEQKSHRGQVTDPEHDHRLHENKNREDDPSQQAETPREREAREREEFNDKRREDEEIQQKKENQEIERLQEQQRAKTIVLQNTPWGQHNASLSKGVELTGILLDARYGADIRRIAGTTPTVDGLNQVRAFVNEKIANVADSDNQNYLIELNSRIANVLLKSKLFK